MTFFSYICAVFMHKEMKRLTIALLVLCCCCLACGREEKGHELLQRSFYNTVWERFDYVQTEVEITKATSFDLSLQISFTDDYPYDYIDLVFVVFTQDGDRYRGKEYIPKLKDAEGNWSAELVDGCYTFILPINKDLQISDPGTYRFHIEQKMPITPIVGVKEMTLLNNKATTK